MESEEGKREYLSRILPFGSSKINRGEGGRGDMVWVGLLGVRLVRVR